MVGNALCENRALRTPLQSDSRGPRRYLCPDKLEPFPPSCVPAEQAEMLTISCTLQQRGVESCMFLAHQGVEPATHRNFVSCGISNSSSRSFGRVVWYLDPVWLVHLASLAKIAELLKPDTGPAITMQRHFGTLWNFDPGADQFAQR